MFTVKHIKPNGDELMVECDRFVRERRYDGFYQYTAHHKPPCDNYDYIASWCGDEDRERCLGLDRHTIYVMNRFGSTVATHHFVGPDFSTAAQADPEFVEAARQVA